MLTLQGIRHAGSRSTLRRRLDRVRSDDSGAALLEFAFVAPLLILLFAGIIQFGMVLLLRNNMQDIAQNAARRMAVGEFTSESEVTSYVNDTLITWASPTVTATWPGVGETDVSVTISVSLGEAVPFDLLGLFDGHTMPAAVSMRKEGGG